MVAALCVQWERVSSAVLIASHWFEPHYRLRKRKHLSHLVVQMSTTHNITTFSSFVWDVCECASCRMAHVNAHIVRRHHCMCGSLTASAAISYAGLNIARGNIYRFKPLHSYSIDTDWWCHFPLWSRPHLRGRNWKLLLISSLYTVCQYGIMSAHFQVHKTVGYKSLSRQKSLRAGEVHAQ